MAEPGDGDDAGAAGARDDDALRGDKRGDKRADKPADKPGVAGGNDVRRRSRMQKLRDAVWGRRSSSDSLAGTGGSALYNVGRLEMLGTVPEPLPFELPPAEKIALDPDLPWELRDEVPLDGPPEP